MKNKWLIPVVLFAVLVTGYIIRGFFQTRITVEMLRTDKIEESFSGKGVLIKTENINTVNVGGATEIYVSNGQRVSEGQLIATIYSGDADEEIKIKLADINKKINAILDSNSGDSVFISDVAKIEGEIDTYVDKTIADVTNGTLDKMSEYKYKISTLSDHKAVAKGEKETFSNDLANLRAEKSVLEAKLGRVQTVMSAQKAGVFIEGIDGFEKDFNTESIYSMTPGNVKSAINRDKNGELPKQEDGTYTYKIVDNYSYLVAVNIDDSITSEIKIGDSVKLRFTDFAYTDCPATVRYVSDEDEDGLRTVVAECSYYIDGLLSERVVNVDFVKKSVSGYKVKIEYLHTVDDSLGLFVKRGAVMKFIPVDVVYSTEEEAIVSASSGDKPIKSYDEVVIAAPEYFDGRVIVSH